LPSLDKSRDKHEITRILHDSFGWALTKDRPLFESIFAKDEDFFTYFPDSTVVGWSEFEKYLDGWMDPRNKAKGYDIRDLRIVISETGAVAWFSAMVDDEGEFDGEPWGAKDIRWTGVLERRGGSWKICQQHMSEPKPA
jgi:ketosteroid isomerase-like protein